MLRRIFMALLIACLALPAAAQPMVLAVGQDQQTVVAGACHETPAPPHAPDKVKHHDCIGCAPMPQPAPQVGAPQILRALDNLTAAARPLVGTGSAPAIPPPRA